MDHLLVTKEMDHLLVTKEMDHLLITKETKEMDHLLITKETKEMSAAVVGGTSSFKSSVHLLLSKPKPKLLHCLDPDILKF
uniref:Uncharacterized protein n=1 Tax=Knipowitschia caucasica TaxID=637954 RepID=A0AAV2LI49_KNICA